MTAHADVEDIVFRLLLNKPLHLNELWISFVATLEDYKRTRGNLVMLKEFPSGGALNNSKEAVFRQQKSQQSAYGKPFFLKANLAFPRSTNPARNVASDHPEWDHEQMENSAWNFLCDHLCKLSLGNKTEVQGYSRKLAAIHAGNRLKFKSKFRHLAYFRKQSFVRITFLFELITNRFRFYGIFIARSPRLCTDLCILFFCETWYCLIASRFYFSCFSKVIKLQNEWAQCMNECCRNVRRWKTKESECIVERLKGKKAGNFKIA